MKANKLCIPEEVLNMHLIDLGKTRSGKSTTLRHLVEHLADRKERVVIIDPKGDWWGLKTSQDGNGPGYPFIAFGDFKEPRSDMPINSTSGKEIAQLVGSGNRSCIIGMRGWMPAEMSRFWIDFASTIFNSNSCNGLKLFIDEVHNFAPKERYGGHDENMALHWTKRLMMEGGGLGITIFCASQRPANVHNSVLTQCETLIAMKVIHSSDREAVESWVKGAGDKVKAKEVLDSLAAQPRGVGWVWSPECGFGPEQVTFPLFTTFDSFAPPEKRKVSMPMGWSDVNLDAVKEKLAAVLEEKKANDPAELRRQIVQLKAALAGSTPKQPFVKPLPPAVQLKEVPILTPANEKAVLRLAASIEKMGAIGEKHHALFTEQYSHLGTLLTAVRGFLKTPSALPASPPPVAARPATVIRRPEAPVVLHDPPAGTGTLTRMARAFLTALAQYPAGLSKSRILNLTEYRASGPVSDNFADLVRFGWATAQGNSVLQITPEGLSVLGPYEPLPTGEALRQRVMTSDKLGRMEKAFMQVLFDQGGASISKGQILEITGYKPSGPVSDAFARLVRLEYAQSDGLSLLKAHVNFYHV